jgi:hypothetical protein
MQTTKAKVWNLAKQHELDDFIAKVAKTFPDALEIVHVQTRTENAWCYARHASLSLNMSTIKINAHHSISSPLTNSRKISINSIA